MKILPIFATGADSGFNAGFGLAARFSGYLIPVAMSGILITVLFEPRLAVLMNIILTLLLGFVIDGEFNYIVVLLVGGR